MIKVIATYKNNPENSSTRKIGEQTACAYSVSMVCPCHREKNKHSKYRDKDEKDKDNDKKVAIA